MVSLSVVLEVQLSEVDEVSVIVADVELVSDSLVDDVRDSEVDVSVSEVCMDGRGQALDAEAV